MINLLGRVAEVPHRQTLGEPEGDLPARVVLIPGAFSEANCGLKSHLRETETAPTSRAIPLGSIPRLTQGCLLRLVVRAAVFSQ